MTGPRLEAKCFIKPPTEAGTDLTYVYTLIHSFLKERSHTKAASALKKAVTGIITIDDGDDCKGQTLEKILEEWRELKAAANAIDSSSSDSSSDSSDDDSQVDADLAGKNKSKSKPSDSSDDSSDDSDVIRRKSVSKVAKLLESKRDSSKTLSSADDVESDEESKDETGSDSSDKSDVDTDSSSVPTFKKNRAEKPATSSSDVASSSSSDSGSDEEDELPNISEHKTKSLSSSDSSSDSDSDENSNENSKVSTTKNLKRKAPSSSSSDSSSEDDTSEGSSSSSSSETSSSSSSSETSSSSESEDELDETPALSVKPDPEARVTKKRRTNEEGKAVVVATTTTTVTTLVGNARGGKASRKLNAPFQRVKVDAVKYYDEKLKDNSFGSREAREDDYGARANRDLIVTRGDGFRKEKNKKKRGSYRGGDITLQSHSFKFED